MRKLASIQTVSTVEAIPEATAIERIRVLGWWVVVKKGEFRPGDRVVYCEIDSLLPERPEFEFLRASSFKPPILDGDTLVQRAGLRIKTVRLRGQVSQGICFPLSILPPNAPQADGDDVTELLDIIKYEPPAPVGMGGRVRGGFPGFLSKTDEIRVQVLEPVLQRHRGKTFHITEKLDGTSFSAFLFEDQFGVCSRNLWMDETDTSNVLVKVAQRLELETKLRAMQRLHGFSPAIQGELIGPGIQKNKYALPNVQLHVFNLINLNESKLVDHERSVEMTQEAGLTPVPQLGTLVLDHTIDELVQLSTGPSTLNPKAHREGIVFRPTTDEYDHDVGGRLSFKVINPQFLLKYDE
jgi:RNA ligase (TIGR02306 family)